MPTDSTVTIKLLPYNARGTTQDISTATALSLTTRSRYARPYPPGNFTVNGGALGVRPASVSGDLTLNWTSRNRLTEGTNLVRQDAADVPGETGQVFRAVVKVNGVQVRSTLLGAGVETYTYTATMRQADNPNFLYTTRVEIYSVANSLDSFFPQYWQGIMTGASIGIMGSGRFEFTSTAVGGVLLV